MAKLSDDKKYVTVESGDTLWGIASTYLGSGSKYTELAAINKIPNPDLIYDGQKIYLTSDGSSTGSSSNSNTIVIDHFGLLSTSDDTLFATWSWSKDKTESYKVSWTYDLGNGVELQGSSSTNTIDEDDPAASRQSTFTIPEGARTVYFKVKPIAKKKSSSSDTRYWTIGWSKKTYTNAIPLETPGTPSVEIDDLTLTAKLENIDITGADSIVFQVVQNDAQVFVTSQPVTITTGCASYSTTVAVGNEYKVRCYAYNTSDSAKSDWSSYSSNVATQPAAPQTAPTVRATSKTSISVEWEAVTTAISYNIEYTNKKEYFDVTTQTSTQSGIEGTRFEFVDIETGKEYFFRVQAVNKHGDESEWSDIAGVVIGEAPLAPTTWSSTTTAIVGEPLNLYWVHNAKDGSSQTYAELELTLDGVVRAPNEIIKNTEDEDEKDKTSVYAVDTSEFEEGTKLDWRVRTAGIALDTEDGGFGEWSTSRTVDIYARPTLDMTLVDSTGNEISELGGNPLTMFPFYMNALAGPKTQTPIGYYVTIVSNQMYETVDAIGNTKIVNDGEAVYSAYFDGADELRVEFTPGNIDLESTMSYTATCRVTMNSGLSAEVFSVFEVEWAEVSYLPDAEVNVDTDSMTATIRPYCQDVQLAHYKVEQYRGQYTKTTESIGRVYGTVVPGVRTQTGELVYSGVTADGEELYYCEVLESTRLTDVILAVYRREYDGKFTELGSGLDAALNTAITDPHPALDYARYRIVATSKSTGAISYYDIPGHPVGCNAIVIQWDEDWVNFEVNEDAVLEQPNWSGSLLKLSYNVDVSENPSPDVSFIEYIGREHPVSYYGTQIGESANWSTDIPKSDKETIYALRRLAKWMGNVYVREPSGVGYWAHISVSFSQKHCDPVVPVSFSIRRVEGGV